MSEQLETDAPLRVDSRLQRGADGLRVAGGRSLVERLRSGKLLLQMRQ